MPLAKLVIVGDSCVGKTSLLNRFAEPKFNVYEAWDMNCVGLDMSVRQMYYRNTDVFNVVFSVVNPKTFENVEKLWIPEIRGCCPNIPILLVGNMIDLRNNSQYDSITTEIGEKLAHEAKPAEYIECSCKTGFGISNVFQQNARVGRRNWLLKEAIINPRAFRKNSEESEKFTTCSINKTHCSDVIDPPVVHYH